MLREEKKQPLTANDFGSADFQNQAGDRTFFGIFFATRGGGKNGRLREVLMAPKESRFLAVFTGPFRTIRVSILLAGWSAPDGLQFRV